MPPAILDVAWPARAASSCSSLRRVAACMVAARMAAERGEPVGATVGWHIRFERRVGPATRIEVITEGLLTRRLQADPLLEGVSVVIPDELHERSQHADLAVALLAEIRREVRPDLRLVAMSATLDPGPVAAFLDAAVVEAAGRTYPVEITYESRVDDRPSLRCAAGVRRGAARGPGGPRPRVPAGRRRHRADGPGAGAIWPTWRSCRSMAGCPRRPRTGPSPWAARAVVVLATNVAETSVTLDGVAAVVDTGLSHQPVFDPAAGLTRLLRRPISRASADQRAGRAGRTGPGRCHRLWTQGEHTARPADDVPELLRADLTRVALEIRGWGPIRPPSAGSAPAPAAWAQAEDVLRLLGAWDEA
ncbi:MAG: helicase-related protein [bacterium]